MLFQLFKDAGLDQKNMPLGNVSKTSNPATGLAYTRKDIQVATEKIAAQLQDSALKEDLSKAGNMLRFTSKKENDLFISQMCKSGAAAIINEMMKNGIPLSNFEFDPKTLTACTEGLKNNFCIQIQTVKAVQDMLAAGKVPTVLDFLAAYVDSAQTSSDSAMRDKLLKAYNISSASIEQAVKELPRARSPKKGKSGSDKRTSGIFKRATGYQQEVMSKKENDDELAEVRRNALEKARSNDSKSDGFFA